MNDSHVGAEVDLVTSTIKSNRNPFRYGADFGPEDLVDRTDEIAHVERVIRDGMRLFFTGPRGFGKTSILRGVQAHMSRKGAVVLYVNAETSPDVGKLIGEIVAGTAAQLHDDPEAGILRAGKFFSYLRPAFSLPADGQGISVSIGIDLASGKYRQMQVLADTLDSLDKLAHTLPESRPVALIVDEFSALMARFGVTGEAQIRSVVQRHHNVGYIFAGSNVGLMMDMTSKYRRPFYRGGDHLYLRPVPTTDFTAWLHKQFTESGFEVLGSEPVLRILALAEDVPYSVQMLAHNCWNELRSGEGLKLTVDLVETAFEQVIRSLDSFFGERWTQLTPLQQKTLTAVLHGKGERMRPSEIAHSIESPASSVRSALRALYSRNILWHDWNLRKPRVLPQDPFFGHWIRMRASLSAPATLISSLTAM
jgi:energy-coupling factor transporter ATP-binding protein EcfA2